VTNDSGVVLRTAGAVLMGLSLTACPAEDDGDDSGATTASGSTTAAGSTSSSGAAESSSSEPGSTSFGSDYGTAETANVTSGGDTSSTGTTGTGTDTDTDTDTDTGSTSLGGADYGVPETTGG